MVTKDTTDKQLGRYLEGQATGVGTDAYTTMGARHRQGGSAYSGGASGAGDGSAGMLLVALVLLLAVSFAYFHNAELIEFHLGDPLGGYWMFAIVTFVGISFVHAATWKFGFFGGMGCALLSVFPTIYASTLALFDVYFPYYTLIFDSPVSVGWDRMFKHFCAVATIIVFLVAVFQMNRFYRVLKMPVEPKEDAKLPGALLAVLRWHITLSLIAGFASAALFIVLALITDTRSYNAVQLT